MDLLTAVLEQFAAHKRVGILMSGKGSNADWLLYRRDWYPDLHIAGVFSDNKASGASHLGKKYDIDVVSINADSSEMLFGLLAEQLSRRDVNLLLYAGFMRIAPPYFTMQFPGVNIHPADLTIVTNDGIPRYRGMHALGDAVAAGESYVASTVHVVDSEVDCGTPIAVTRHLRLSGAAIEDLGQLHETLKVSCEHQLYPLVVALLAKGSLIGKILPLLEERGEVSAIFGESIPISQLPERKSQL